MRLTFLGKESTGGQSPTLYATDRDSYVVQGWKVADPTILALETEQETVVEVPAPLMRHLAKNGLAGVVTRIEAPIIDVTTDGNYIIQGARVTDQAALALMDIPGHETCVEVSARHMQNLVASSR
ncbi:hypothetical protein GA0070606_5434 [Micromonospora citrea]|uniref:Uncharacterized protein n=1 Tax=Micromonospora citrea TaxID=47855 RepID=A0A1C6VW15_9ACTN|nr:hypothetical protein [Micromonospora citrea]SCL70548.1 hypothetical protein GA0070606_5434 [Micromonospora citrea]